MKKKRQRRHRARSRELLMKGRHILPPYSSRICCQIIIVYTFYVGLVSNLSSLYVTPIYPYGELMMCYRILIVR
jgi:hypothetical protein